MTEFKYPSAVYDVIAGFDDEEQLAMALIVARKKLDIAVDALKKLSLGNIPSLPDDETMSLAMCNYARDTLEQINETKGGKDESR